MTKHKTGTREEWLAARLELLRAEKAQTRQSDKLTRQRQSLPWVRIDKEYRFETDAGTATLADLFGGRSRLLIYHFMFGPDFTVGCPTCTSIANAFNGSVAWLANHDVTLCAVSQAPLTKLRAYKERMGWSFPWASANGTDFKHDFQETFTQEQKLADEVQPYVEAGGDSWAIDWAKRVGVDWATYRREIAGLSAFALEDGAIYYTYASYEQGLDEFSVLNRILAILTMVEP